LAKDLSKSVFIVALEETFHEKVALLLGVLEAHLLSKDLSMALVCRECSLNIELETLKLLVMEVVNGILSASRAIQVISSSIKADKCEGLHVSLFVSLSIHKDGLNLTIFREVGFD
jgi:hypothetical protein